MDGLRLGKTTDEIVTDVNVAFEPYTEGATIPSKSPDAYLLRTIVRTNTSTLYNQARLSLAKGSIERGVLTQWLYSATLDDRTSDICGALHGTILPADDSAIKDIAPPRHYNCRSIMIPITKYRAAEMAEDVKRPEDDPRKIKEGLDEPTDFYDGF